MALFGIIIFGWLLIRFWPIFLVLVVLGMIGQGLQAVFPDQPDHQRVETVSHYKMLAHIPHAKPIVPSDLYGNPMKDGCQKRVIGNAAETFCYKAPVAK